MKTPQIRLLLLIAALFIGAVNAYGEDLAIIVAKTSPLDSVTTAELQKYFKAEKTKMPDGTKIVLVMQALGQPAHDAALQLIYKMSETEYNDYFVGQVFTGAVASAPKSFPTAAAVISYVAANSGAMSYVRASDANDTVKVLKIDGKAPGEADYSLKMK